MTVKISANSVILILFAISDNLFAENSKLSADSCNRGNHLLGCMQSHSIIWHLQHQDWTDEIAKIIWCNQCIVQCIISVQCNHRKDNKPPPGWTPTVFQFWTRIKIWHWRFIPQKTPNHKKSIKWQNPNPKVISFKKNYSLFAQSCPPTPAEA